MASLLVEFKALSSFAEAAEVPESAPVQICRFLEAALVAGHLCLPKLASIAVYIDNLGEDELPELRVDDPTAPEDGAQGVCNMLGNLVTAGVLPALTQACPFPQVEQPLVACKSNHSDHRHTLPAVFF